MWPLRARNTNQSKNMSISLLFFEEMLQFSKPQGKRTFFLRQLSTYKLFHVSVFSETVKRLEEEGSCRTI